MKKIAHYLSEISVSKLKLLVFIISIVIFNNRSIAQGTWTWKWGALAGTTISASGLGVFSATNSPGQRYAAGCWTDKNGKFWRYGGDTYADLWCYDPNINQWALMNGGFTTIPPSYGIMGVASPTNTPGGASYGHPCWVDNNGDLWLYGINFSDDLWKYNIVTNMWTWMKGTGGGAVFTVYGTQGTPSILVSPGQMGEIDCNWVDSNNNLWLYTHNDGILWKFDISANMWTWINGTVGGALVYGTIGTFGIANSPSAFNGAPMVGTLYTMWKDKNDNLFMIANRSVGASNNVEIWKYSIVLNQWACMRADASSSSVQTYASQCLETTTNFPIARTEMRVRWLDDCDNLWTYGGVEYTGFSTFYNDIWRYNSSTNKWVWVRGGIATGTFGTMGVASSTNNPNPIAGSQRWIDKSGFWLTGGQDAIGTPSHHLWLYRPDTVIADFSFTTICPTTNFTDLSTSGCNNIKSHYWNFGDPASGSANIDSISTNPSHTFTASGTYSVTLIVKNCTWDSDTIVKTVVINCGVNTLLNNDTICLGTCINLLAVTSNGVPPYTYQWDNGIIDTTAGPINICPTTTTTYQVITTDFIGDKDTTLATIIVVPPASVFLGNDTILCNSTINLNASAGYSYLWSTGAITQNINASISGSYWIQVSNGACTDSDTINIQINSVLLNLGNDTSFCQGSSITLDATNLGATYLWSNGFTTPTVIANNTGQYWVQVVLTPCVLSDTINITTIPYPNISLPIDTVLCPNTSLTLDAGGGATNYLWSTGETTQTININSTGIYSVTTSNFQCSKSDTSNVIVLNQINWNITPDLCESINFSLDAGIQDASYVWSTGETSQVIDITSEGTYWVVALKDNCILTDTLTLTGTIGAGVLFIPNSFTPNDNELNDVFSIKGENVIEFHLMIFDRWGEKIFESKDITQPWDGKYKGKLVQQDVYVWKVEFKTACNLTLTERIGHVIVVR